MPEKTWLEKIKPKPRQEYESVMARYRKLHPDQTQFRLQAVLEQIRHLDEEMQK